MPQMALVAPMIFHHMIVINKVASSKAITPYVQKQNVVPSREQAHRLRMREVTAVSKSQKQNVANQFVTIKILW